MSETIYYKSPLGTLTIRSEDNAILKVSFTNRQSISTVNEEEINYSRGESSITRKCIEQLDEYFRGERLVFDLQLAQKGSPFQQSVWAELLNIGYGKTLSYLSLSKKLGNVKAIRAVGTANGRNDIAIIVPCHRVIGSNGSLVGYSGDLWRKKWLLDLEAKYTNAVLTLF